MTYTASQQDIETLKAQVAAARWHHDFEIMPGLWTNGTYRPHGLLERLGLPGDLRGMSLADVGASNGFFSLEAWRRGARVSAYDYRTAEDSLFDLACRVSGAAGQIAFNRANVLDIDPGKEGAFDHVLCLGVLYHTPDPVKALANCLAMTAEGGRIYLESYCIDNACILPDGSTVRLADLDPRLAQVPLLQYLPDPRREGANMPWSDYSNFAGPSSRFLRKVLEDFGFQVEMLQVVEERVVLRARSTGGDALSRSRAQAAYGLF